jgi:hypothetical protein
VKMAANTYFEMPFRYTGIVTAICSGTQTTAARVGDMQP